VAIVLKHLKTGALVSVLDRFSPQENWFKAYVPKRRMGVARVVALIDWLKSQEL